MSDRKQYQLQIPLSQNVQSSMTNGFENYRFEHSALPEINFNEIDVSTNFCGKKLNAPFLISSMTGGNEEAGKINARLAKGAEVCGVAMGVGSERVLVEVYKGVKGSKGDKGLYKNILESFNVRKRAKLPLLLGNLGAVQLNNGLYFDDLKRAKELIGADGMFLHLNSLQEALQENGNTNFREVLSRIEEIMTLADFPVIVKEVGFGINQKTALQLKKAGVKIVDVAGGGGSNWVTTEAYNRLSVFGSRLSDKSLPVVGQSVLNTDKLKTDKLKSENRKLRTDNRNLQINFDHIARAFQDWGNPTAQCVEECCKIDGLEIIASGGIRNGAEVAKAIALGARMVGIGLPLLSAAQKSETAVIRLLNTLIYELKIVMFGVGAKNLEELKKAKLLKY